MLTASDAVAEFTSGKTLEDYRNDLLLRSAVERQLTILGEALAQLGKVRPDLAERVPERAAIVGFRNLLVHGYAAVIDELVWATVTDDLPKLRREVGALLEELGAL